MSYALMNKFLYCEINIIGFIITGILLNKSIRISGYKTASVAQKTFCFMLLNMLGLFVLDGATWLLDGVSFSGSRIVYYTCLAIYFSLNPLVGFFWGIYVKAKTYGKNPRHLGKMVIYSIPVIINTIMAFSSPVTGWLFYIGSDNKYYRGSLYLCNFVLSFVYYIVSTYIVAKAMKNNFGMCDKKELKYLMLFPIMPFMGMAIQSVLYGISVIYISVLIAFLIIFLNVQNEQIYTDSATGLNNRRYLNNYLGEKAVTRRKGVLGVILIDLDYFKILNDTYGHTVGDKALKDVADILKKSLNMKDDCISRFGGDEFVVALERNAKEDIYEVIDNIKEGLKKFNDSNVREYKLSFSIGCTVHDAVTNINADMLLKNADLDMYHNKEINHSIING